MARLDEADDGEPPAERPRGVTFGPGGDDGDPYARARAVLRSGQEDSVRTTRSTTTASARMSLAAGALRHSVAHGVAGIWTLKPSWRDDKSGYPLCRDAFVLAKTLLLILCVNCVASLVFEAAELNHEQRTAEDKRQAARGGRLGARRPLSTRAEARPGTQHTQARGHPRRPGAVQPDGGRVGRHRQAQREVRPRGPPLRPLPRRQGGRLRGRDGPLQLAVPAGLLVFGRAGRRPRG